MPKATTERPGPGSEFLEEPGTLWHPVAWYDTEFRPALHRHLNELAILGPNWDGYGAPSIDPAILAAAHGFVNGLPEKLPRPTIVPMSSGNLQLEWREGQRVLELEFETPTTIHYLKWDPDENLQEEDVFPAAQVHRAVELIRWFMKSVQHV